MKQTIIIIGGGPGGYVAAIRAAQLGAVVHLVEQDAMGGTCLNVGCIPTKALLHSAGVLSEIQKAKRQGITAENISFNWAEMQRNKAGIVKKLVRGVSGLLSANGVIVHNCKAELYSDRSVVLETGEIISGDHIILATGSIPTVIPFPGYNLPGVLDSTGALSLQHLPRSICILGGGVIGCEFAELFSSLGVAVTIVEMLPAILPTVDTEIAEIVRANLTTKGISIHTNTRLTGVELAESGLMGVAESDGQTLRIDCEKVIVAVGRRANTSGLGLEKIGVLLNRGAIAVNDRFETSVPGIYAIGDCNGRMMLAHAASAQGEAAVEHCFGKSDSLNHSIIPNCIYTSPEVAGVGQTEEQIEKMGIRYHVGRFSLSGNGKSLIEGCTSGLIKLIVAEDETILGAHMIGPRVTDMIAEVALAMQLGAKATDIANTIHAHPTLSEAVAEAAMDAENKAIHWPPRRNEIGTDTE